MRRSLKMEEKKRVIGKISDFLKAREDILFAYIYGSFVSQEAFNDIDVGIYVSLKGHRSPLDTELDLEAELENIVLIPVDVRVLNHAPLSFVYNVLRERIVIVDKDKTLRADFEGLICKKYFDFKHLRDEYLREIINAPI